MQERHRTSEQGVTVVDLSSTPRGRDGRLSDRGIEENVTVRKVVCPEQNFPG